jgi:phage pi2 protein 07
MSNYPRKYINHNVLLYNMPPETVIITKKEYQDLKKHAQVDKELLKDIATGIKDILQGKVKEI